MAKVTVTSALRDVLQSESVDIRWVFSDPRKPKGFSKAVGVKLASKYLTAEQIGRIQAKMEKKGFIAVAAKTTDYRSLRARFPGRYMPWGGTRLTFAKPEWALV